MMQLASEVVDITDWRGEEESRIFPVGTREKKLIYCPARTPYAFLEKRHRYLFKLSVKKCPEQFWIEIFAYRLGARMGIQVPPAFVAYDRAADQCGALMRWFLEEAILPNTSDIKVEKSEYGGDLLQGYIINFDQKKGLQHNFETISKIFEEKYSNIDWKQWWARTFVFDALMGDTDRHQNNWGIIYGFNDETRLTPVFDNGTSMGYEIKADRFHIYEANDRLKFYVLRGKHHMKWKLDDTSSIRHSELIEKYADQYPETRSTMLDCLHRVNSESFQAILNDLTKFDVSVRLTEERVRFMLRLLEFRHKMLLNQLG